MTLAPIRGAPPGATNPAFPTEEPEAAPGQPTTVPTSDDQPQLHAKRKRHTPVEIGDNGTTLTFAVVPEIPAIVRASMTIHVTGRSSSSETLGYLRMSAQNAREFLTNLGSGHFPVRAAGDEDGTVQIAFEVTGSGLAVSIYRPGQREAIGRLTIDRAFDLESMANELLADLGE